MSSNFETMLQHLPNLATKIWTGRFTITSSFHEKSAVYQVHCHRHPDDSLSTFVFLTAEGKTIDEAADNLFKHFRTKCKEYWDGEIKKANEAESSLLKTEETMRQVIEQLNTLGAGIPSPVHPEDAGV